jgi:hypothetical protein
MLPSRFPLGEFLSPRCIGAGAALKLSDRIYWGEISSHPSQGGKGGKGKPSDESLKRQGGFLAVNMARSLVVLGIW